MKLKGIIKTINACHDDKGNIKCATSYDDWCESCLNNENKKIIKLVEGEDE